MKRVSKKVLAMFLTGILAMSILIGCGTDEKKNDPGDSSGVKAEEVFGDIEPLDEEAALNIGVLVGGTHGFASYMVERLGGFEYANIDATLTSFASGPVMVESMASGAIDCGAYGLGGTLAGTIGQDIVNLGALSADYYALMIFASNDSKIVKDGAGNISDYPLIYGTADDWKGTEIYCPIGTTLHYMLGKNLEAMGLTLDDVSVTHMDVPNINTALRAGQADIGALWSNYCYGDIEDQGYTPVMSSEAVDIELVTTISATETAIKEKRETIKKWMELLFAVQEWVYSSDENYEQAVKWFVEWNEDNGYPSTEEECDAHLQYEFLYTLDQNYEMFSSPSQYGTCNALCDMTYDPLKFYVEQGNYTQADLEKVADAAYWDGSIITELYEAK